MRSASLDTSFLISFSDPGRKFHHTTVAYYRYCVAEGIPMYVSVLAAGEYAVRGRVIDLPLASFRVQPFTLPQALKAAAFRAALLGCPAAAEPTDPRHVIINDLNMLGQAAEEEISIVLSEDENTLARMARRLRNANLSNINVLLLKDGFAPDRFVEPDQLQLGLQTPPA